MSSTWFQYGLRNHPLFQFNTETLNYISFKSKKNVKYIEFNLLSFLHFHIIVGSQMFSLYLYSERIYMLLNTSLRRSIHSCFLNRPLFLCALGLRVESVDNVMLTQHLRPLLTLLNILFCSHTMIAVQLIRIIVTIKIRQGVKS